MCIYIYIYIYYRRFVAKYISTSEFLLKSSLFIYLLFKSSKN